MVLVGHFRETVGPTLAELVVKLGLQLASFQQGVKCLGRLDIKQTEVSGSVFIANQCDQVYRNRLVMGVQQLFFLSSLSQALQDE